MGLINPLKVADVWGFESGKEVTIKGAGYNGADFLQCAALLHRRSVQRA